MASGHSVSDPAQAQAVVELCVAEFGSIDGPVDNAGLSYEALPWQEEPDRVCELVEVNVLGVMSGIAAVKAMIGQGGGGSIVNVPSGASLGQRKLGVYAAQSRR